MTRFVHISLALFRSFASDSFNSRVVTAKAVDGSLVIGVLLDFCSANIDSVSHGTGPVRFTTSRRINTGMFFFWCVFVRDAGFPAHATPRGITETCNSDVITVIAKVGR
jgi:hypothetical protein